MHLSCVQSVQAAVTIIKDFASQFTLLQAKNARLQQDVQSSSAQLDETVKIAATARQEADSLRKELGQLKKKLKEEEKAKTEAQAQAKEKDDLLRKSTTALLGNFIVVSSNSFLFNFIDFLSSVFVSCRSCRYSCKFCRQAFRRYCC
jgi:membrane-associated HD superfamily phosphohydrolase